MKTSDIAILVLVLLYFTCTGKGMSKKPKQNDSSFSIHNCHERKMSEGAECKRGERVVILSSKLECEDRKCKQESEGDDESDDNEDTCDSVCKKFPITYEKFDQTCYQTCKVLQDDLASISRTCRLKLTLEYNCHRENDCPTTKLNCWNDTLLLSLDVETPSSLATTSLSSQASTTKHTATSHSLPATGALETSRSQDTDSSRPLPTQPISTTSTAISVTNLQLPRSRRSQSRRVLIGSIVASVLAVIIAVVIILLLKYRKQQLMRFFSCLNCSEVHEEDTDTAVYELPNDDANQAVFKHDGESTQPAAYEEIRPSDKEVVENILYEGNTSINQAQYDQLNFSTTEKKNNLHQYNKLEIDNEMSKSKRPVKEMHENQIYVSEQTSDN